MMKTSESDPLLINTVRVPGGGAIGLTFCPGKKQELSMTGPWDRDLDADLDRILAFKPSALVTLMEADELESVEVPPSRLADEVFSRGIDWHHLPIRDVDVPDESWERLWLLSGPRLRAQLATGGRIVLHCRGGLGRTGTIAGRLLVELGVDPEEAIRDIRDARPGSIETAAQEEYVRDSTVASRELGIQERITGSLIAGAIGDALGAPVEFISLEAIRDRYGPAGIQAYSSSLGKLGAVTDDTQMLMFTAEGLILGFAGGASPGIEELTTSVWRAYLRWLTTQTEPRGSEGEHEGRLLDVPELWARRAPGMTCLGALQTGKMGTVDRPLNQSKGCGGVMRVAPAGLVGGLLGSVEEAFTLGTATAAITHGHPAGHRSAGFLAAMLSGIMSGLSPDRAWAAAEAALTSVPEHDLVLEAVHGARRALDAGLPTVETLENLGEGWVGEEALAIALYAALSHQDLERAILFAVNHGGDTDSTGAITGNILGTIQGAAAIPPHLWRPVEMLHPLLTLAEELAVLLRRSG